MLNLVSIMLIVLNVSTSIYCNQKRYDNYKVFRIVPRTKEQVAILRQLGKKEGNSFWVEPYGSNPVDLQIAPNYLNEFNEIAMNASMNPQIFIDNIQKLIDNERTTFESRAGNVDAFGLKKYNTIEQIYAWMDLMKITHPEIVENIVAGNTYQGRVIRGVQLRFGWQKPGIFIEGGMHGREWISPATVIYLIDRLLNSNNAAIRELAGSYNWFIFPVCNPDGYVYSYQFDRMWQKTVSDTGHGDNPRYPNCKGVDLNRNFDYMWQHQEERDNDPCNERYAGPQPFSEIESKSLSTYIKRLRGKLLAYISVHSYSQLLLVPYDYTPQHLENYRDAINIGSTAIAALSRKYSSYYRIGNRAEMTETLVSGTAMDWAKGSMQLELAFTYKLRDIDTYGFVLPESEISKTGQEFVISLVAMFQQARSLDYPKDKNIGTTSYTGDGSSSHSGEGSSSFSGYGSSSSSGGRSSKSIFKMPRCLGGR